MTAKDEFTIPLRCPNCGKTGQARCWQWDGWSYAKGDRSTGVTEVTPGFKRVKESSGYGDDVNFACDDCDELSAT